VLRKVGITKGFEETAEAISFAQAVKSFWQAAPSVRTRIAGQFAAVDQAEDEGA
jgi:hypothetical protein